MKKTILILLLCLFLTFQALSATYTYVPGYGITNLVYIESKAEDIIPAVLGKPDITYNGARGKHAVFEKYGLDLLVRGGLIECIKITSPYYFSKEGIGTGSTCDQVIAAYGSGYMQVSSTQNTVSTTIGYLELGVAFTYRNSDNKVTEIILVKPNTPFNY